LRGNGGGSICLGYQVINRLMNKQHPEGEYDFIRSDLMDKMFIAGYKANGAANTIIFDPGFFADKDGNVYNNLKFLQPGIEVLFTT